MCVCVYVCVCVCVECVCVRSYLHTDPTVRVQLVVQQGSVAHVSPQSHCSPSSMTPLPQNVPVAVSILECDYMYIKMTILII